MVGKRVIQKWFSGNQLKPSNVNSSETDLTKASPTQNQKSPHIMSPAAEKKPTWQQYRIKKSKC